MAVGAVDNHARPQHPSCQLDDEVRYRHGQAPDPQSGTRSSDLLHSRNSDPGTPDTGDPVGLKPPSGRSPGDARPRPPSTTPTAPPPRARSPCVGPVTSGDVEFHPDILRPAPPSTIFVQDPRRPLRHAPFGIAPTGFTCLMQAEGETAGAGAAGAAGIPFTLPLRDRLHRGRRQPARGGTGSSSTSCANGRSPAGAPTPPASTPSCSLWTIPVAGARLVRQAAVPPFRRRSPWERFSRIPVRGGGLTS